MRINTNIASLQAQRQLATVTRAISRSLERLASGRRVNSAKDDPAGLAISDRLEASRRGMSQALRNMNDARAYLETADSALGAQTELVHRMRELALQAANGTLSANDRSNLNLELQTLLQEFERITNQTSFNGQKLLDGSFSSINLQVGIEKGQSINLSIADTSASKVFTQSTTLGTGAFKASSTIDAAISYFISERKDLNGDGILDFITSDGNGTNVSTVHIGRGDGTFLTANTFGANGFLPLSIADYNGDGKPDFIITGNTTVEVWLNNGSGSFTLSATVYDAGQIGNAKMLDLNGDGLLDLTYTTANVNHIRLSNGHGAFQAETTFAITNNYTIYLDLNHDGKADFIDNTFAAGSFAIFMNDGNGTFTRTQL